MSPPVETGTDSLRTWDAASTPAAVDVARRFELAWQAAPQHARPDPADFLPENPSLRPGVLLALLRSELGLRFEAGESPRVEAYHGRHPELDRDALVALVYEEYCLREEIEGRAPDPAEYDGRFPGLAESLRRVLDIHSVVGPCPSTATHAPGGISASAPKFPEAGQTIGGFHLVAEIGRGSFARVFRAEERQLADRPVALKVSRTGSREPQALARLQHTHIVPVYSYRTDPVTGLHLLCMPFLGSLTLAQVLADKAAKDARHGADLVEALERLGPHDGRWGRPTGRLELARRGYAEAIAWWGARMAEALQHAHDRGVLHRDVKPSNVLITPDGLPMLLDFNLAQQPITASGDGTDPGALGGTLAYMAPEQLQALADGRADGIDGRADLFALGVLLYEAATGGVRPFDNPRDALTVRQALERALAERRAGPPALRGEYPEIPPAFEAVLKRCLAADPANRYASAADLAIDLQAVADRTPLKFAREPIAGRVVRGWQRNRGRIAFSAPLILAMASVAALAVRDRQAAERLRSEVQAEVQRRMSRADVSYQNGATSRAIDDLGEAVKLARLPHPFGDDPMLHTLAQYAQIQKFAIQQEEATSKRATDLFRDLEPLYALLIDPEKPPFQQAEAIEQALAPFYVLRNPAWAELEDLEALDAHGKGGRERLIAEIDDLLFLWAIEIDRDEHEAPSTPERILDLCRRGRDSGPWKALKERWLPRSESRSADAREPQPEEETSAEVCLQWALLRDLEHRPNEARAWLRQASVRDPSEFWAHVILASWLERDGEPVEAWGHAEAAAALRPDSPQARSLRDRLFAQVAISPSRGPAISPEASAANVGVTPTP
ncbi:MAG: serine/threonine-protein kinase [Isosphaeraceae bacterium]